MNNRSLQMLAAHVGVPQAWDPSLKEMLQDLQRSNKLEIDPDHFNLLCRMSDSTPEEVAITWIQLTGSSNVSFTWKVGESSDMFQTCFQPFVIN